MANRIDILLSARGGAQVKKEVNEVTSGLNDLSSYGKKLAGAIGIGGIGFAMTEAIRMGVRYNATLEQTTVAFRTLLGSADAATERVRDLAKFAADTPYELPEVINASRLLQSLTGGALASGDALRLVGDAAAAAGRSFEETAMWVGRLYAGLKSGTAVGEATMRLLEMGLISGETKRELEALALSGKAMGNAMEVVEGVFSATSGAMALQAEAFNGRLSTLKDTFAEFVGLVSQPINDSLVWWFEKLTDALKEAIPATSEFFRFIFALDVLEDQGEKLDNTLKAINRMEARVTGTPVGVRDPLPTDAGATTLPPMEVKGTQGDEEELSIQKAINEQLYEQERTRQRLLEEQAVVLGEEDEYWRQLAIEGYRQQNDLLAQQAELTREVAKEQAVHQAALERSRDFGAQLGDGLRGMLASFGTAAQQAASVVTGTLGSAISAVSTNISAAILQTKSWAQAFADVGRQILTTLVNAIVQFFVTMLVRQVLAAILGTSIAATQAASMSALWAGPAVLASIATYGSAAAVGPSAVAGALGAAPAIAMGATVAGFQSGGYTGDIPIDVPAGITHGREFVFDAPATQRIGPSRLEDIRSGRADVGEERPVRVVIVDDRRSAERLAKDPRFRNAVIDITERA